MTVLDGSPRLASTVLVSDRFGDERRRGKVIGQPGAGPLRRGRDVERVIGIDHDALRIGTMATPGWGREGVAYGPFEARPGRSVAVHVLNGHNTSESYVIESVARRLVRWGLGSETDPVWRRALRYPRSRPREHLGRKLRYWARNRVSPPREPLLDNLAVGWFGAVAPSDPLAEGTGLVVRATGTHNGGLHAIVAGRSLPLLRGLQNLPVHYVSVLREVGAIHYAASSYEGASGLPAHPALRPLAVDRRPLPGRVHPGVHQHLQGQIGFSCDTRVYDVTVADVPELGRWCTSAIVADRLTAAEPRAVSEHPPEVGPRWLVADPRLSLSAGGLRLLPGIGEPAGSSDVRGPGGAVPPAEARWRDEGVAGSETAAPLEASEAGEAVVVAEAPEPLGLVHAIVGALGPDDVVSVLWRWSSPDDHWRARVTGTGVTVESVAAGTVRTLTEWTADLEGPEHALQINDDGRVVVVAVDGRPVSVDPIVDERFAGATGVGISLRGGAGCYVRDLEAHPRLVPAPAAVRQRSEHVDLGEAIEVETTFPEAVGDLDGLPVDPWGSEAGRVPATEVPGPAYRWHRLMGDARLEVAAPGVARFDASLDAPVRNRTAYVVDWPDQDFCDVEIVAAPPVRDRPGHRCRVGLLLWQDPLNYVALNAYLDDHYPAASASTFFVFRGFEDIYDAVWSNLGDLVRWGSSFRLRLVSDGRRYLVLVNDEPVLHRVFSDVHPSTDRLLIRKAGIVANWEWGHETGSTISYFAARRRPVRSTPGG
jgi:hypothetical protein